jgi:structural maintenance of chromosome 4
MVVDEVSDAQACIEYLRKNNVGRASFMVLKKLKSYGMDKVATPENVPRLFDLLTPNDERYAPAFFKAIGNTLVANDMDQANRIAFGRHRWRVVTLAGGVIETSGAMSGGGSQVSRGGMSSKRVATISPETLKTYEDESSDAANRLQEATANLQKAEMELDGLSTRGPEIDMAYQKLGLDIENVKKRITEAEKRVKDLGYVYFFLLSVIVRIVTAHPFSAQNKPNTGDLARISRLEQEIAKANDALEKLREQSSRIDQDIKSLEKKILDIGGSKLLSQKSKVDGIRLHINLANEEITKAEVAKSKAEKDAAKLETTVNTNTKALEAIETELEELDEQIARLVEYVAKLKENVENAQNAAENSKEDLETLKVKLDAKEEQIAAFRQKEVRKSLLAYPSVATDQSF